MKAATKKSPFIEFMGRDNKKYSLHKDEIVGFYESSLYNTEKYTAVIVKGTYFPCYVQESYEEVKKKIMDSI